MTPPLRLSLLTLAAALVGVPLAGAQMLTDSPFLPPAGATLIAPPPETLQLSGVIASGESVLVNLTDSQTKRSLWIPVGKTVDDIEVLSCDLKTDTVVVRAKGQVKTLKLRTATIVTAPASAPLAPSVIASGPDGAPAPLLTQAEQEREARMLVSDLLEIGLQQRKAYEEAQRKAAAAKAAK
ncbi:hypothetical protein K0B96_04550 [Horticoccus luteus]|uniref:Uncharacterized protein n=1 Tax=Horticoccus luteus TaxID=2862869 RepID=A0A8F9TYJ8_9BACT|nr:hypothetical protein [Horticoccus luteus]QYM79892.1 hypothetical protein K0B96_04550 [Horticoccus luteus]